MPSFRLRPLLTLGTCLLALPASGQFQFGFDPEALEALQEAAVVTSAGLLAEALRQSRHEALAAGTQPIPTSIREQLHGHFPEALLSQVRYRVGGGSELSLQLNVIEYGDRAAITLVDVVVFAHTEDALHNVALWAHELWHVRQFQHWGVQGFADRYARDHLAVEHEAEQAAATITRARQRPHRAPASPPR